ncbi:MAG: hypothetical protein KJ737_00585 [Proteobacteria bacterium]|nr:hypothetical protein [Pseudomonadota bacterium]
MGAKLQKAFELVKEAGGLKAQMRLAMKSGISSEKADSEPDSPEKISKMEVALKELTGNDVKL